jgi:glutathione synthase
VKRVLDCRLDGFAVSVFYLRAGYTPDDYPSRTEWDARCMMENCTAVSCPTVAYQLVGAKKIQQDLAVPGAQTSLTATILV